MKTYLRSWLRLTLTIGLFLSCVVSARADQCAGVLPMRPPAVRVTGNNALEITYLPPRTCNDVQNIMWAYAGGKWEQFESNAPCVPLSRICTLVFKADLERPYLFKIQSCWTRTLQSSRCIGWSQVSRYLHYGPDTCQDGYVWRDAFNADHVCVSPGSRQRARDDNSHAGQRHVGGSDICVQGYVWREASPSDHVCVVPQVRSDSARENREAESHFARNVQ